MEDKFTADGRCSKCGSTDIWLKAGILNIKNVSADGFDIDLADEISIYCGECGNQISGDTYDSLGFRERFW